MSHFWIRRVQTLILCLASMKLYAQDPSRFRDEVEAIVRRDKSLTDSKEGNERLIVFTGSSSIRLWSSLQNDFPDFKILNSGFGGSQMSDLLYYHNELILAYQGGAVYIYEGDNDLAEGKDVSDILITTRRLIKTLKEKQPDLNITFISPKPSPARWHLQSKYLELIKGMKKVCKQNRVGFVDVWTPMLLNDKTIPSLYLQDSLHMTQAGYGIWQEVIGKSLRKSRKKRK